jgi:hypothetical protein
MAATPPAARARRSTMMRARFITLDFQCDVNGRADPRLPDFSS